MTRSPWGGALAPGLSKNHHFSIKSERKRGYSIRVGTQGRVGELEAAGSSRSHPPPGERAGYGGYTWTSS